MPKLIAKTSDVIAYTQTDGEVVLYKTNHATILTAWATGFITAIAAIIIWAFI